MPKRDRLTNLYRIAYGLEVSSLPVVISGWIIAPRPNYFLLNSGLTLCLVSFAVMVAVAAALRGVK